MRAHTLRHDYWPKCHKDTQKAPKDLGIILSVPVHFYSSVSLIWDLWSAGLCLIIQEAQHGVVAEAGQLPGEAGQVRRLLQAAPHQPLRDGGDGEEGLLQAGDLGPHGDQLRPEAGTSQLPRLRFQKVISTFSL